MFLLAKIGALFGQKPRAVHLQRGKRAEKLTRAYLRQQGLRLVQANYPSRWGEIDLIMQQLCGQSNVIVFIEVRYRQDGQAIHSIGYQKQQRIKKTAQYYLQQQFSDIEPQCRFDVVLLSGDLSQSPSIEWIQNAFQ